MARSFILDASALLASLFEEPGAAVTEAALAHAAMSSVNYSEVIANQVRKGAELGAAMRMVDDLDLPIFPWDAALARESADLFT